MNQVNDRWSAADIRFELIGDLTDSPVMTLSILTPAGSIQLMGEPDGVGTSVIVRQAHMQGALSNAVGAGNLRLLAQLLMEEMDLDELIIEGSLRTTGANPGRKPKPIRFRCDAAHRSA
jgi:hypothetical protein